MSLPGAANDYDFKLKIVNRGDLFSNNTLPTKQKNGHKERILHWGARCTLVSTRDPKNKKTDTFSKT